MSTVTRWWWVRHAPVIGRDGIIYGRDDVPCDTSDEASFRALAAALPGDAVWVTSALRRTHATAAAITAAIVAAGAAAPDPAIERDLDEQSFGDWQGLRWRDLHAARDPAHAAFWEDPGNGTPPGGESIADLMARAGAVIHRLTEAHAGRDIVAVCHSGTIRGALALALELAPRQALSFKVDTLSVTRIEHVVDDTALTRAGAWRVVGVNHPARWIPPNGA